MPWKKVLWVTTTLVVTLVAVVVAVIIGIQRQSTPGFVLRVAVAGPPASGKGTLCAMLSRHLGLEHIGTGDLLRAEISKDTALGRTVAATMASGGLVDDSLLLPIVLARLRNCSAEKRGWLLDGFPRNVAQALAMVEGDVAPHVVLLDVPDDVAIARAAGRRVDPVTGIVYHLEHNPPPKDDAALIGRLVVRPDDTEERIKKRLATYHTNTKMWLDALLAQNNAIGRISVCHIDATQSNDEVFADSLSCLAGNSPFRWLDCGSTLMKPFC